MNPFLMLAELLTDFEAKWIRGKINQKNKIKKSFCLCWHEEYNTLKNAVTATITTTYLTNRFHHKQVNLKDFGL